MVKATDITYPDALPSDTRLHCYVLESVLGQGGFAVTYLARDTYLDQLVAIKEYFPIDIAQRGTDNTVRARTVEVRERYRWGLDRFLIEARTLARFDHPNIVRVLSVFEQSGTAYMVMRYEKGGNLSALLDHVHTLPEPQLLGILLPILEGIELVHDAKFIHRDIKPDNVYIRADDSPVLLDFGSARQALGEPRTMTALVTSGYTPFEQYQSDATCGPWTDIYSLGATCYRAISGVSPADALTRVKSSLGSLDDPMVPAQVVGKGRYSPSLLTAIDQALKISERERPQTVREWRDMIAPLNSAKPARPEVIDPAGSRQSPTVDTRSARDGTEHPGERSRKMTRRSYRWMPVVWAAGVSGVISIAVVGGSLLLASGPNAPTTPATVSAPTQPPPVPPNPVRTQERPEVVASLDTKSSPENEAAKSKPTLPITVQPATPSTVKKAPPARAVLELRSASSTIPRDGASAAQKTTAPGVGSVSAPAAAHPAASAGESAPTPTTSPPPVQAAVVPAPSVAVVAIAPSATISTDHPNADVTNEPGSQPPPQGASKADTPADDESLAAAGDADAQLRVGEVYAAGKSGYPNPLAAYVYFKLALLGGKSEAGGRLKEQERKLQPPEIRQADAKVDSLRRSFGAAAKQKAP
jgi:serine/threonine protein kinase